MSRLNKTFAIAASILLLTGCNLMPSAPNNNLTANTQGSPTLINTDLPVKKIEFITEGNNRPVFEVEMATTSTQRQIGLMNRDSLDEKSGMLFVFDRTAPVNFWMKNTLIPLDIIYIDNDLKIKHIVHDAKPCTEKNDFDCPKYNSIFPVKYVIELYSGVTTKNGIKTGDSINFVE